MSINRPAIRDTRPLVMNKYVDEALKNDEGEGMNFISVSEAENILEKTLGEGILVENITSSDRNNAQTVIDKLYSLWLDDDENPQIDGDAVEMLEESLFKDYDLSEESDHKYSGELPFPFRNNT